MTDKIVYKIVFFFVVCEVTAGECMKYSNIKLDAKSFKTTTTEPAAGAAKAVVRHNSPVIIVHQWIKF